LPPEFEGVGQRGRCSGDDGQEEEGEGQLHASCSCCGVD
jgi:hypothetical protein